MSSELTDFSDPFADASVGIVVGALTVQGGAEEVAATLASELNAPVYTTEYNAQRFDKDFRERMGRRVVLLENEHTGDTFETTESAFSIRGSPVAANMQTVLEDIDYSQINADILIPCDIDATSIAYHSGKPYVSYIHHPNKVLSDYFWDEFDRKARLRDKLSFLKHRWTRVRHMKKVAKSSDLLVCNSERTRSRTIESWKMDKSKTTVLYPPLNTDYFTPGEPESLPFDYNRYFFAPQRLEAYKNIHTLVEGAKRSQEHLVLSGSGTMEDYIRRETQYSDYIHYLGYVDNEQLRDLYRGAEATVQGTLREDFGIVPTESFACGTPCIVPASGGFLETVGSGYTEDNPETYSTRRGLLIGAEEYSSESVAGAFQNFDKSEFDVDELREDAEKYSTENFMARMNEILNEQYYD